MANARHIFGGLIAAAFSVSTSLATASMSSPTTAPVPATQPELTFTISDAENKHLERQAVVALERLGDALDQTPPAVGDVPPARALALTLLDAILHEPGAPNRPAIGAFRAARTKRAIDDMQRTKVTGDEAIVWQIYNMGFVVRTRTITMGFDLVKLTHVPMIALDDETMKAIVDQCDVLFVSHEHLDHADHEVAAWFLDAGKPVLAPDAMWLCEPLHDRLTHLPTDGDPRGHALPLRGGATKVSVTVYPGRQAVKDGVDVDNNVYVVTTADGFRIAHTGDNNVKSGLPPASLIQPVDLLIMKFVPSELNSKDIVRPFQPRVVLPAHFEELGHANVNGREPFWRGMERAPKLDTPTLLMMWGERYRYVPTARADARSSQ